MSVNRLNKSLLNQLVGGRVAFVASAGAGPRYLYVDSALTAEAKKSPLEQDLEKNPYYKKYAEKLAAAEKKAASEKAKEAVSYPKSSGVPIPAPVFTPPKTEATPRAKFSTNRRTPQPSRARKLLQDIVKTELIEDKTSSEITHIWREFHKNKNCLSAVVPGNVYKLIKERGRRYPTFLLPLPRSQGYEFVLSQFFENEVHMTLLINYQTHGVNAPECLSLVYYPDIIESKDIVPMRGEYDTNSLTILEAQCLASTLQLYYGQNDPGRTEIMEKFTKKPDSFNHMDLIKQMETLGFSSSRPTPSPAPVQ